MSPKSRRRDGAKVVIIHLINSPIDLLFLLQYLLIFKDPHHCVSTVERPLFLWPNLGHHSIPLITTLLHRSFLGLAASWLVIHIVLWFYYGCVSIARLTLVRRNVEFGAKHCPSRRTGTAVQFAQVIFSPGLMPCQHDRNETILLLTECIQLRLLTVWSWLYASTILPEVISCRRICIRSDPMR